MKDPRVGNVTITAVSVRADLATARIFFVPFAGEHTADEVLRGADAAPRVSCAARSGAQLELRHAPRLEFEFDDSFDRGRAPHAPHRSRRQADRAAATTSLSDARRTASCCSTSRVGCPRTRRCSGCARLLGGARPGTCGSLDPLATGMLPICLGEATKVAGELLGGRKRYRVQRRARARAPPPAMPRARWSSARRCRRSSATASRRVLARFRGAQTQVPPMYSALKREGQPLYRLARAGHRVERAARAIEIDELELLGIEADELELRGAVLQGHLRPGAGARTSPRRWAPAATWSRLRRADVEPFDDEAMVTPGGARSRGAGGRAAVAAAAGRCGAAAHLPRAAPGAPSCAGAAAGPDRGAGGADGAAPARVRGCTTPQGAFLGLGEVDGRGSCGRGAFSTPLP